MPSDDGRFALAEFVARNRAALLPLLNDKTITSFEKGIASAAHIESVLGQYRKGFTLNYFGMVTP